MKKNDERIRTARQSGWIVNAGQQFNRSGEIRRREGGVSKVVLLARDRQGSARAWIGGEKRKYDDQRERKEKSHSGDAGSDDGREWLES